MRSIFNRRLKVQDLLDIDYDRIKRSRLVDPTFIKSYVIKEDAPTVLTWIKNLFSASVFHNLYEFKTEKGYKVFIETDDKFNVNNLNKSKVRVFCTCADFKYRAAYGLYQHDNLFFNDNIKEFLGEALTTVPTKVSPTPVCKHVYSSIKKLKTDYTSFSRYKRSEAR